MMSDGQLILVVVDCDPHCEAWGTPDNFFDVLSRKKAMMESKLGRKLITIPVQMVHNSDTKKTSRERLLDVLCERQISKELCKMRLAKTTDMINKSKEFSHMLHSNVGRLKLAVELRRVKPADDPSSWLDAQIDSESRLHTLRVKLTEVAEGIETMEDVMVTGVGVIWQEAVIERTFDYEIIDVKEHIRGGGGKGVYEGKHYIGKFTSKLFGEILGTVSIFTKKEFKNAIQVKSLKEDILREELKLISLNKRIEGIRADVISDGKSMEEDKIMLRKMGKMLSWLEEEKWHVQDYITFLRVSRLVTEDQFAEMGVDAKAYAPCCFSEDDYNSIIEFLLI
jgi:hypothetical protein